MKAKKFFAVVATACGLSSAFAAGGVTFTTSATAGYDFKEVVVAVDISAVADGSPTTMTVSLTKLGGTAVEQVKTFGGKGVYPFTFAAEAGCRYVASATIDGTTVSATPIYLSNAEVGACSAKPNGTSATLVNAAWGANVPAVVDSAYILAGKDYTLSAQGGVLATSAAVKSTVNATYDDYVAATELPDAAAMADAQTALALAEDDGTKAKAWYAYVNGAWVALTGSATETGSYVVTAEIDYNADLVRFTVKKGDDAAVVLKQGDAEWIALNGAQAQLASVGFSGSASVGDIVIDGSSVAVVDAGGTKYNSIAEAIADSQTSFALLTDAKFDAADATVGTEYTITENGKAFKWVDGSGKYANYAGGKVTVSETAPANGYSTYESKALDIDSADPNAKPVLVQQQNNNANAITFKVDGLGANATATYSVEESDNSGFSTVKTYTATQPGDTIDIPLPGTKGSAVKYYRVKFNL